MTPRTRLLAVSSAVVLGLAGTAVAETTAATDGAAPATRLFLANDGADCGAGDAPFLTGAARTTDLNCGYVGGGVPFGEVAHQTGALESGRTFATRAKEAITFVADPERDAAGVVVVRQGRQQGVALPGTGQVVADIAMSVKVGKKTVPLGSQTLEGTAVGGGLVELPFTFDLPASLAGLTVDGVSFDLDVRGVHLFHGFMNLNGSTFVDVPTVVAPEPAA